MPLKGRAKEQEMTKRREAVARLRLRHGTTREIVEALKRQGMTNPDTGEHYELATIHRDIKWLEADWKEQSQQLTSDLKAKHLAELREVRRAAWQANGGPKLFYVLKSLEQEARVAGLEHTEDDSRSDAAIDSFLAGAQAIENVYQDMRDRGEVPHDF